MNIPTPDQIQAALDELHPQYVFSQVDETTKLRYKHQVADILEIDPDRIEVESYYDEKNGWTLNAKIRIDAEHVSIEIVKKPLAP